MDSKRVTAERLLAEIGGDVERMARTVADALNRAEAGAIIDQGEEPVRDALADLRRQTYQKAIDLLSESRQDFSPSGQPRDDRMAEQKPADHDAPDNERALDGYLAKRVAMTDYPTFVEQGDEIGSGPTESFCIDCQKIFSHTIQPF